MRYALGIDLGTTYTAAAVARDQHLEIVELGAREAAIPSVLFVAESGDVQVGQAANRRGLTEPNRVARNFKRRVGDQTPLLVAGTAWPAHLLMSRLFRVVVDTVASQEASYPAAICLTHPANWGDYKLDLLRQATRHAGFGAYPIEYVSEPEAAAVHYASRERVIPGAVVAIYDLGGGTFDAAVLRRTPSGRFEVVGRPEGIEHLGGIDFDAAVLGHVDGVLAGAVTALDADDQRAFGAVARLQAACVEAKESLSTAFDASISVELPGLHHEVRITRSEFEAMIRPAIGETVMALQRTVASAGLTPDQLQAILLVGGSSRIPLVGHMVYTAFGRPVAVDAHPKHAVALGAALAADMAAPIEPVMIPGSQHTVPAPSPDAPAAPPVSAPPAPTFAPAAAASAKGRRPRVLVGLAATVVVIGSVLAAALLWPSTPSTEPDPQQAATPSDPVVWLANPQSFLGVGSSLVGIDTTARRIVANQPVGPDDTAVSVAVTADDVWVLSDFPEVRVHRFFRSDGSPRGSIELRERDDGLFDVGGQYLIAAGDGVWVVVPDLSERDEPKTSLYKVDAETGELVDDVEINGRPDTFGVATDGHDLWLGIGGGTSTATVVRVDGESGETTVGTLEEMGGNVTIGVSGGDLWVVGDAVVRLDAQSLEVAERFETGAGFTGDGLSQPQSPVLVGESTVAVVDSVPLVRLLVYDASSGESEAIDLSDAPAAGIGARGAQGDGARWVLVPGPTGSQPTLVRVGDDGEVTEVALPPGDLARELFVRDDRVIVTQDIGPTLDAYVVDASEAELLATVPLEPRPLLPAFIDGRIWVADRGNQALHVIVDDRASSIPLDGLLSPRRPPVGVCGEVWVGGRDGQLFVLPVDSPEDVATEQLPEILDLYVDGERVWGVDFDTAVTIDPAGREVAGQATIAYEGTISGLPLVLDGFTAGGGAMWFGGTTTLGRVDGGTLEVTTQSIDGPVLNMVVDGDRGYASTDGGVVQFSPATGAIDAANEAFDIVGAVVVAGDVVWHVEVFNARAHLLDDQLAIQRTIQFGAGTLTPLGTDDALWLAHEDTGKVLRLDPETGDTEATVDVGGRPAYIVGDGEQVWVTLQDEATMVRIDPQTNDVDARVVLGG